MLTVPLIITQAVFYFTVYSPKSEISNKVEPRGYYSGQRTVIKKMIELGAIRPPLILNGVELIYCISFSHPATMFQ